MKTSYPVIYSKEKHGIGLDLIDANAIYIINEILEHNHFAYLVGGSVRDLLLGVAPKDFDVSTSARPEEIKRIFPRTILVGKRFRLAHVRVGRSVTEVATFRSGDADNNLLIKEDNTWGSAEEDALRRDLTINGLFYDISTNSIIDYVGGYEDINRRIIRTIGNARIRFKQDPVRMLRCLKFQARFGLDMDPEIFNAIDECCGSIIHSSRARISEEILRVLESGSGCKFIQLIEKHNLLRSLSPKISDALAICVQDPYSLLAEVDNLVLTKARTNKYQMRLLGLSCLMFPIVDGVLKSIFCNKRPAFESIREAISETMFNLFSDFLSAPKRLVFKAIDVISSQYRICPIGEGSKKMIRIPRGREFSVALQLFYLRSKKDSHLREIYLQWSQAYEAQRIRRLKNLHRVEDG